MRALPFTPPTGETLLTNNKERNKPLSAGDVYTEHYAAPGCGSISYDVTRVNEATGDVYGTYKSGGPMELDPEDCI